MRASIFSILAILLSAYLPTAAAHAAMQDDVDQAVVIIERFQEIPGQFRRQLCAKQKA